MLIHVSKRDPMYEGGYDFSTLYVIAMSCYKRIYTVKPVYNEHLYNESYYTWFI